MTLPDRNSPGVAVISGLQLPGDSTPGQSKFNRAVKDWIELRQGARQNPRERVITAGELQDHLNQLGVVTFSGGQPEGPGIPIINKGGRTGWASFDAFSEQLFKTKLLKDLTRKVDDPTRFDDLPARVREIMLGDLHELARQQGASVREFQEIVQNERESLALKVIEVTAAVDGASAGVRQLEAASASATRAVAVVATTITARLDNFPNVNSGSGVATVEVVAQAIADRSTGLEAQYVVKVSAGGYQAGIGLASTAGGTGGTPTSAFIVQADKFAVVDSSYTGGLTNSPPADSLLFGVDGDGAYVKGNLKVGGKAIIRGSYTSGGANAALHVNDTATADHGVVSHSKNASGGYAFYGVAGLGAHGVYGEAIAGRAVEGHATTAGGIGVKAFGALGATALNVEGPMVIDNSTLVANLNADKLDGYDGPVEGAFTPTFRFSGGSTGLTYLRRNGYAMTFGNMAFFRLHITLSAKGSSTGLVIVGALPWACRADSNFYGTATVYSDGMAAGITAPLTCYMNPGETDLYLTKIVAGTVDFFRDTDVTNSTVLTIHGFYFR